MHNTFVAPKKRLTRRLSCTAYMLFIQYPDADVFLLAHRRYYQPCKNAYLITGMGDRTRQISLESIVRALGITKAAVLPGFNAFTGADQTGWFAGKGQLACWQALSRCPVDVVSQFADDLRWRLFAKKQLEAQKLPPRREALQEAITLDKVPHPQLLPATGHGWNTEEDQLVTTMVPLAPASITHNIYSFNIWQY